MSENDIQAEADEGTNLGDMMTIGEALDMMKAGASIDDVVQFLVDESYVAGDAAVFKALDAGSQAHFGTELWSHAAPFGERWKVLQWLEFAEIRLLG